MRGSAFIQTMGFSVFSPQVITAAGDEGAVTSNAGWPSTHSSSGRDGNPAGYEPSRYTPRVTIARSARISILVLLLAVAAASIAVRAHVGLELGAHERMEPKAIVAGTLGGELDAASSDWRPRFTEDLIGFALERTRDHLIPDPGHSTDLTFLNDSVDHEPGERPRSVRTAVSRSSSFVVTVLHTTFRSIPK